MWSIITQWPVACCWCLTTSVIISRIGFVSDQICWRKILKVLQPMGSKGRRSWPIISKRILTKYTRTMWSSWVSFAITERIINVYFPRKVHVQKLARPLFRSWSAYACQQSSISSRDSFPLSFQTWESSVSSSTESRETWTPSMKTTRR